MPRQGRAIFDTSFLLCISLSFLLYSVVGSGIPLGSRLSVEERNYWISSNGDFAIGFFNSSNQYSLGIRFVSSSIPESKQMVVWVAGGDLRVGSRSHFQFTKMGELVLYDSATEEVVWTSKTGNESVVSAVLHDDGNLVLLNRENDIIWQSFDTPSDTLLPGQNLSALQMLRPHSMNSVSSYYSLFMDESGQLQLRFETSVIYWTSGNPSESAHRAMLNTDGTVQLLDQRSKPIWSIYGEDHNDSEVKFRFLRLDPDGNLRLYSWQDASKSWISGWQAFENQCDVFATCILRGICLFDASGSPICKCPFAYPGESNAKCLVPSQESCQSGSSMITYEHTSLYGIYPPNEIIVQTSLRQCKILCQEDPLCSAATFINNGSADCRIIKTQYVGGQSNPSLGYVSFVKTCLDPIAVPIHKPTEPSLVENSTPKASRRVCFPCLMGVAAGTVVVFVMIQFGVIFYTLRRRKHTRRKAALTYVDPSTSGCIMLSYPEIIELTENFKHQIGPQVFKGMLPDNGPVAIKKLSTTIDERKFRIAVSKMGSIYHKNLLKLDGFCCDSDHRLLIYEFARNGSLGNCLADPKLSKRLTWKKRIGIGLAVARAVFYLHTECREFVSHGNLKSENVLLDDNLEAKVSEYGLQFNTEEISNIGGMAEVDVRDFGKMLVRLITGCQDTDGACEWAYGKWAATQTESIADHRMEGGLNLDELERALRIAFWCLQEDARMRPSMGEVVKVLEGTLPVDIPPPVFSHCHMSSAENNLLESTEEP